MLLTDPLCHTATVRIAADARTVFDYLRDGRKLGKWTFGSWDTEPVSDGLVVGTSLFDGGKTYVRVIANEPSLQVDFAVGRQPDALRVRIAARVLDGATMGTGEATSCVTMISWRTEGVTDERWRLTCSAHEAEVFRLRHLIEAGS